MSKNKKSANVIGDATIADLTAKLEAAKEQKRLNDIAAKENSAKFVQTMIKSAQAIESNIVDAKSLISFIRSTSKVKGSRTRISDETKARVKSLTESGKTRSECAAELGISLPSVQNILKAAGMVKARK